MLPILAALASAEFGKELISKALDKLTDPALNVALGPAAGLQVTPVVFQSVEQEGRWKPTGLVDQPGRDFSVQSPPAAKPPSKSPMAHPFGNLKQHQTTLFTVQMPGIATETQLFPIAAQLMLGDQRKAYQALTNLIKDNVCTFTVDAIWWSDDFEIFAGYAGLGTATAFGSVFNTTASVTLQAVPFGNYYPAAALVTWAGWVNPIGPGYWEFQGATVLLATGLTSAAVAGPNWSSNGAQQGLFGISHKNLGQQKPSYMYYWNRSDGKRNPVKNWNRNNGYLMAYKQLNPGTMPPLTLQPASP